MGSGMGWELEGVSPELAPAARPCWSRFKLLLFRRQIRSIGSCCRVSGSGPSVAGCCNRLRQARQAGG